MSKRIQVSLNDLLSARLDQLVIEMASDEADVVKTAIRELHERRILHRSDPVPVPGAMPGGAPLSSFPARLGARKETKAEHEARIRSMTAPALEAHLIEIGVFPPTGREAMRHNETGDLIDGAWTRHRIIASDDGKIDYFQVAEYDKPGVADYKRHIYDLDELIKWIAKLKKL